MVNVSFKMNEIEAIERLLIENQGSARLQNFTHLSYTESIELRNKIYRAKVK